MMSDFKQVMKWASSFSGFNEKMMKEEYTYLACISFLRPFLTLSLESDLTLLPFKIFVMRLDFLRAEDKLSLKTEKDPRFDDTFMGISRWRLKISFFEFSGFSRQVNSFLSSCGGGKFEKFAGLPKKKEKSQTETACNKERNKWYWILM